MKNSSVRKVKIRIHSGVDDGINQSIAVEYGHQEQGHISINRSIVGGLLIDDFRQEEPVVSSYYRPHHLSRFVGTSWYRKSCRDENDS